MAEPKITPNQQAPAQTTAGLTNGNPRFQKRESLQTIREAIKESILPNALYSAYKAHEIIQHWKKIPFATFSTHICKGKIKGISFGGKLVYLGEPFDESRSYISTEILAITKVEKGNFSKHLHSHQIFLKRGHFTPISGKALNEIFVCLKEAPIITQKQAKIWGGVDPRGSTVYLKGEELLCVVNELEKELPPVEIEQLGTILLTKLTNRTPLSVRHLYRRLHEENGKNS
ncbi:MAG: hypothetical protein ABIH99_01240 [Candidatus Micrarchaeota archaeon]